MFGQHVIFEGSLAKKLRFWVSKLHFWRKSRRKASFWSFKTSFLKEVASLLSLEASCLKEVWQKVCFWTSKLHFLNVKSIESQIKWISNWTTCQSIESQSEWLSNQLNPEAIESEIVWTWNRLNLTSLESQVTYLNLKPFESQINDWQLESRISWQPNRLNLKSIDNKKSLESQIHESHLKPHEMQNKWIWNRLTFEPIHLIKRKLHN